MTSLRADPERWTIVVVGSWNQAIFSEDFVRDRVFKTSQKITTEIGMTATGWIPLFHGDAFRLLVHPERVMWTALNADADTFRQMEASAINLLSQLRVTPIRAVGINLGFNSSQPSERLKTEVSYGDLYGYKKTLGLEPKSVLSRITFDADDRTLNVSVEATTSSPTILIDVNFHKPVRDADEAILALRDRADWARERSAAFLREAWDLEF